MTKTLLSFLFLFFSVTLLAQSSGVGNKATVDNTLHYTLPASADIHTPFVLDIKALNFKDANTAESFFGGISDNLLTYTYDRTNKNAVLRLNIYPGSKLVTVSDWNRYIAENVHRYFQIYTEINK